MRSKEQRDSILTALVVAGGLDAEPEPVPADCPHYEEFTMYARSTQALGATAARGRLIELTLRDRNPPNDPVPADYCNGIILNFDIEFARSVRDLLTKTIDEASQQVASGHTQARARG